MTTLLPNLTIKHNRIENPESVIWDLSVLVFNGANKPVRKRANAKKSLKTLPVKYHQISIVSKLKEHAEALLDSGLSASTISSVLTHIKFMFGYLDEHSKRFDNIEQIRQALFEYSEYQYTRANLKKIKHQSAYGSLIRISWFLNGAFDELKFEILHTRLRNKTRQHSAMNREAEKVMLTDARKLAMFCYEITKKFDPKALSSGFLPVLIEANNQQVNLSSRIKIKTEADTDFKQTNAYMAFNLRVTAELFIFLGMTVQNQAPTYRLKRSTFAFKALSETYEVREYKSRRGGEVLFKIPKQYKADFEKYLSFLDEYAPDSEWLFPYLEKSKGFRKRSHKETDKFKRFCRRYGIPWIKPNVFRKIGENLLMRLANDEKTAADYANHAIATFRQNYKFPSLQRCMIEVGRFWDSSDPLNHGQPKVSLFNSPCNGVPQLIDDATNKLPEPDCITPTGCIGCRHYRDDDSFDYVWGLHSFKFLKIIESSSYHTKEQKPSMIAIDWVNMKIDWFKNSEKQKHKEWVKEAWMRVEEGYYHPDWSRKIQKFEV